jgi:streptogramin lyase
MPRLVRCTCIVLALVQPAAALAKGWSLAPQPLTEFSVPAANPGLTGLAVGPDGNLWFKETAANRLGRLTPDGTLTELPLPPVSGFIFIGPPSEGITSGPDGNLWVVQALNNSILRVTPGGAVTEFVLPTKVIDGRPFAAGPLAITAGADGNLWFTESAVGQIGRITPDGSLREFALPVYPYGIGAEPTGIAAGADGNLWFAETNASRIGRITTGGVITEFPIGDFPPPPPATFAPYAIVAGTDRSLHFTEIFGAVGKITLGGDTSVKNVPHAARASGLAQGPDGNFWITDVLDDSIALMTPDGDARQVLTLPAGSWPSDIIAGPNHTLWFVESGRNKIARLSFVETAACEPEPDRLRPFTKTLCLDDLAGDRRWKITAEHTNHDGNPREPATLSAFVVDIASFGVYHGGLLWFFGQDNPEVLIKVLDGCPVNGRHWVFVSAVTSVGFTIHVEDTRSGQVKDYSNTDGVVAAPVADTSAFTCGS